MYFYVISHKRTFHMCIWVRSRNCGCLVTWFCYQLIAKPGNKTAKVPWPDPYLDSPTHHHHNMYCLIGSRKMYSTIPEICFVGVGKFHPYPSRLQHWPFLQSWNCPRANEATIKNMGKYMTWHESTMVYRYNRIKWGIQYIPRNMHTVLLCFALLWLCNEFTWSIYPYSSGLLCWHWCNR